MHMKINNSLVKTARLQRAWGQQQLADVSGLSLRTIQRIESTGDASLESIKALGAALELQPDIIQTLDQQLPARSFSWQQGLTLSALTFMLVLLGYTSLAHAESVMLELSIDSDQFETKNLRLVDELGKSVEVRIDDQYRLVFTPTLTATKSSDTKNVNVAMEVYRFANGVEMLVSTPRIITANNVKANLLFELEDDAFIDLDVTPKL